MIFSKAIVIGCPGAGKSTFARRLGKKVRLPLVYLDSIFWRADKTSVSEKEFDDRLRNVLDTEKRIIDGNYSRTLEMRIQHCDQIYFLDYPLEVCLDGVKNRIGVYREDIPWIEEEFNPEFRQFIIDFQEKEVLKIYKLIKKYRNKPIVIFKTREQAEKYLEAL